MGERGHDTEQLTRETGRLSNVHDDDSVFGDYARFYDTLYEEKDYGAECRFVEDLLSSAGVSRGSHLLDLGCGTGGHAIPLSRAGYRVTGVDRSAEMLAIARRKAADAGVEPRLVVGDVRTLDLCTTFDAAISMFAVVGYQLTNDDLAAMLAAVRMHLPHGAPFVFDAWFGPAVLAVRPERRTRELALPDGGMLRRTAMPTLDVVRQTVRVDYQLDADSTAGSQRVAESHTMRYLFAQEMAYFLEVAGFDVVELMPFMQRGAMPTTDTWNVTWLARAR